MYRNLKHPDYVALHCMSPVVTQTVVAYYDRLSYCKSLKRNSCHGRGQQAGILVTKALCHFDELTGKEGILSAHENKL